MNDSRTPQVANEVRALTPVDAREAASKTEVLEGLKRLARPFDQAADPVHVTGSALIVGPRGIVLHLHKRLGLWLQPGGHVDGEEWPADAALRESREETGLPVRHPDEGPLLLHVDAHDGGRGHRHLDLRYLLWGGEVDPSPPPEESQNCRWFDWDQAAGMADDGLRAALPAARAIAEPTTGMQQ